MNELQLAVKAVQIALEAHPRPLHVTQKQAAKAESDKEVANTIKYANDEHEADIRATKYAFENDVMALRLRATENKLAIAVEALKQSTTLLDNAMTDKYGNKFVYLPTRRGSMISALDTLDLCNEALKLIEVSE